MPRTWRRMTAACAALVWFAVAGAAGAVSTHELLAPRMQAILSAALGEDGWRFDLSPATLDAPAEAVCELIPPREIRPGRNYFQVRIASAERELNRVVTVDVTRSDSVWVAGRPLPPATVIQRDDVRRRWLEHAEDPRAIAIGAPWGMQLRHGVASGTILTQSLLERPPLVRRGEQRTLCYRSPALVITTLAEVRQDGHAGDLVRVRVLGARKECQAAVRGDGTLEVAVP
ncbi:MAG: flagellar basal body P-ring formation protein FlgA [Candidatus Eisenbacteria bacterium]|nr:flagellar basal body P-ring formation protein FlgA [Candidatus Eisenbacteria bacterium]